MLGILKFAVVVCSAFHFSLGGIVRRQAGSEGYVYMQPGDRNYIQPQDSRTPQNQQQYRFPLLPAVSQHPQAVAVNHQGASNNHHHHQQQQLRTSVLYHPPLQQPATGQHSQPSQIEFQQLLQQHLLSQYATQRTQPKSQQQLLQQLLDQQQKTKQQQQVIYNPAPPAPKAVTQNQQVIYVGGGQQSQHKSRPITNSPSHNVQPSALYSGSQGVSFSTSYSGDVIKQGKVVGSVPTQAIQKAPASEIEFDKGISAKDKAKEPHSPDDEYVVYYYYYYDDDKNKNLTLSFDDIPNLEQYDQPPRAPKVLKDNVSKLPAGASLPIRDDHSNSLSSDPRSIQRGSILNNGSPSKVQDKQQSQDTSPVPNVFRYGSADIPRVPVTPNIASPVNVRTQTTEIVTPSLSNLPDIDPTIPPARSVSPSLVEVQNYGIDDLSKRVEDINDIEVDNQNENKGEAASEPEEITTVTTTTTTTVATTTTTEEATTTEEPTTTTEKNRRRYGGRQRLPTSRGSNNFGRSAGRRTPSRSSTTTTTTTTSRPTSTRRGSLNRFSSTRTRKPSTSFTSTRVRSRNDPFSEKDPADEEEQKTPSTTTSTASTSRRFGGSPRRFSPSSSGNRSPSTSTTTQAPRPIRGRSRPASVNSRSPALNVPSRSRSRPPFLRGRQKEETPQEDVSVATTPPVQPPLEADDEVSESQEAKKNVEEKDDIESIGEDDDEDDDVATEAPPTTTEKARGGIFRTRPRPALFNGSRPRPNRINISRK